MSIERKSFGVTEGREAKLFVLKNKNGFEVSVTNYGGNIVTVKTPDKNGVPTDVVLGYENAEQYHNGEGNFGATVGRYANRIGKGHFVLNGKEYNLYINNNSNHLHGGKVGYNKVFWEVASFGGGDEPYLLLKFIDTPQREGYPGTLTVNVKFTVTKDNAIKIEYIANTDEDTIVNLTNHSYFNLNGAGSGDILGHTLMINASEFTPTDAELIPTGEIQSVEGSAMDFRTPKTIGRDIKNNEEPLLLAGGYDHNYILGGNHEMKLAAEAEGEKSGITMEVYTDKPAIQLYTGNFLDGSQTGKGGNVYERNNGFCLETQLYPDSPNKPQFPSCVLEKDKTYNYITIYKFGLKK